MSTKVSGCCEMCGSDKISHGNRPTEFEVRGKVYHVEVESVVCSDCNCVEVIGDPGKIAFAKYREEKGLLTPEDIKSIRKKYKLSQKSLAALLGMSEATINRYEGGGLQDEAHDQAIRSCSDPFVMRDLLDRKGERLTAWQRKRVEKALRGETHSKSGFVIRRPQPIPQRSEVTGFREFDYTRYAAVVQWFCVKVPKVTPTSLNKLLFYADFVFYQSESVSLTGTTYKRFKYGPVPEHFGELRDRMEGEDVIEVQEVTYKNGNTGEEIRVGEQTINIEWSPRELVVLNKIVNQFRSFTPRQISDYSHEEVAWRDTDEMKPISYKNAFELSIAVE